jgi:hypothetical protein
MLSVLNGRNYLNIFEQSQNLCRLCDPRGKIGLWKGFLKNFEKKLKCPLEKVILKY